MADPTSGTRFFYQGNRLHAVQSNGYGFSLFRGEGRPLAQLNQDAERAEVLICDEQNSVLQVTGSPDECIGYSAYGYAARLPSVHTGLGFNGEFVDRLMRSYLLGSYRLYDPVLMRFCAPDSDSPFHKGGINAYGYCLGDPVNASDPTGHMPALPKRPNFPPCRGSNGGVGASPPSPNASSASKASQNQLPEEAMLSISRRQYDSAYRRLTDQKAAALAEVRHRLSTPRSERTVTTFAYGQSTYVYEDYWADELTSELKSFSKMFKVLEEKKNYSIEKGFFDHQSGSHPSQPNTYAGVSANIATIRGATA